MLTFDSDQDWGPYKTLFDAFSGCNARLRIGSSDFEVEILGAFEDRVEVRHWQDGDEDHATGLLARHPFEDIEAVTIY